MAPGTAAPVGSVTVPFSRAPATVVCADKAFESKKTVKKFLSRLGPLSAGDAIGILRTYLETGDNGQPVTYVNDDATVDKKVRGLVHQIMCLPEFQLN